MGGFGNGARINTQIERCAQSDMESRIEKRIGDGLSPIEIKHLYKKYTTWRVTGPGARGMDRLLKDLRKGDASHQALAGALQEGNAEAAVGKYQQLGGSVET
ncbi:hypothetical protein ACFL6C_01425 [Myxococcota bacterium]